jgi:hypothetical protein
MSRAVIWADYECIANSSVRYQSHFLRLPLGVKYKNKTFTCIGKTTIALTGSGLAGEGVAKGVDGKLDGENWKTGDVNGELRG